MLEGQIITDQIRKKYTIAYLMHGARNVGGGEYSIYLLIKNLKKDIFNPIVFYSHENEIIKKLRKNGTKLINVPLNKNITSVYRDEIEINPVSLLSYAPHLVVGIFKIAKSLRKHKVDILHPHDNLSKIIGGIAAKITGVKCVAHCRDLLGVGLIEKFLILYQLLLMDRIIAVSDCNKELFKIGKRSFVKVQTIYNGIDLNKYDCLAKMTVREELYTSNSDVVLGTIGVFDKCKGHIYLLRAIERIVSEGIKNIVCLVVGDGREREELKRFVIAKNLQDYVRFLGYRKDIPRLLEIMDFVVMPSIQESFPRVPLEAMAMKVPVIATTVGGLPESIENGKTGILVPSGDTDSLGKAIKYLIENPELRRKMGDAGRKRVKERFSIENNVRKTEELYLDVLKDFSKTA
jgi:glycosyltransferase involved in cell wall biosynthesis